MGGADPVSAWSVSRIGAFRRGAFYSTSGSALFSSPSRTLFTSGGRAHSEAAPYFSEQLPLRSLEALAPAEGSLLGVLQAATLLLALGHVWSSPADCEGFKKLAAAAHLGEPVLPALQPAEA